MGQLIFGAWIASGVVLFLPLGTILRLARRVVRRLRPGRAATPVPAVANPGPAAATVAPPPAPPAPARWAGRLSRWAVGLAVYAGFITGAIYYTPGFLSRALDTPYPMAAVTSSSMWPTLKKGDLVVLKGVDGLEDVHVGDVIAFRHEAGFAIHRVVSIEGAKITTQGDANKITDPPIGINDVVGRVPRVMGRMIRVPYLGNIPLLMHRTADAPPPEQPPTFGGQEGVEAPGGQ